MPEGPLLGGRAAVPAVGIPRDYAGGHGGPPSTGNIIPEFFRASLSGLPGMFYLLPPLPASIKTIKMLISAGLTPLMRLA